MVFDQTRIFGHAIAEGARRTGRLFRPDRWLSSVGQSTPRELVMVPQDLRIADPVLAQEFYNGVYSFAGERINTGGRGPFSDGFNSSYKWQCELHSFQWLRHLQNSTNVISNNHAQSLVADWIKIFGRPSNTIAWQPSIAAQRLVAWLCHSVVIVDHADIKLYKQFLKMIGVHIGYLQSRTSEPGDGISRLQVHISLAYAALCVKLNRPPKGALAQKPHDALGLALDSQIYADGGHVSRCPSVLPEILIDLLPLRHAYQRLGISPPLGLLNAIDRIMPAIRYYRHRDGSLARFNGVSVSKQDLIATVLRYDDAMGQPTSEASQSGYQRLNGGPTTVLMDVGNPPKGEYSTSAHAGCLSIEMSSVNTCILTNCGSPEFGNEEIVAASRSTAAHSTAIIHNTSSCKFHLGGAFKGYIGGRILSGPSHAISERNNLNGFTQLIARHDGYLRQFGVWHERIVQLSEDGKQLLGRDKFFVNDGKPPLRMRTDDCAIRFHLHPSVKPVINQEKGGIDIIANENHSWNFTCSGGIIRIEESIFFAGPLGNIRTTQIVIKLELSKLHECSWRFEQTIGTRSH